jgi:hypothetical protein
MLVWMWYQNIDLSHMHFYRIFFWNFFWNYFGYFRTYYDFFSIFKIWNFLDIKKQRHSDEKNKIKPVISDIYFSPEFPVYKTRVFFGYERTNILKNAQKPDNGNEQCNFRPNIPKIRMICALFYTSFLKNTQKSQQLLRACPTDLWYKYTKKEKYRGMEYPAILALSHHYIFLFFF